ncbi:MAG TPA: TolC family protein [Geothrix sp.]|nr:TolC family protein [Geothrix sp.]
MRSFVFALLALGLPARLAAQDLSQTDAVRSALAANPRLEAARASRESSAAQTHQARWDQIGKLDLGLQWNPSYKNQEITLPTAPPMAFQFGPLARNQFQASFTQPVWTWGALSGRTESARLREEAEGHLETREAQRVAFDAARAFLEARQAQEAIKVAEQNLAQEQAFLLTAKARVAQGASAKLDVLKAELSVSESESRLLAARNQDLLAREALVTVTQDDHYRMAALRAFDEPHSNLPSEADALSRAKAQRPDLKQAWTQARALRVGANAERAAGLPSLSFRTTFTQSSDHTEGFTQAANRTYALGLAVQWEALASKRAQFRQADLAAKAKAQEAQSQSLEDQLALEVRHARWNIENARSQVEVAQRARLQAEEQARVSRVAYQEGIRTAVELQGDEVALSDARYRELSAHLDLGLAWASLRLALGD